MGVDIQTYRAKIGTYKHSRGVNVITQYIVVNFSHGLKTVGSVLFIGILLIMAGVEQNPGPRESDFFVFSVAMAFALTIFGVILRITGFANLQLKDICFLAILIVAILIMNHLYYQTENVDDHTSPNEVKKATSVQPAKRSAAQTLNYDDTTFDRKIGTAATGHQRTQRTSALTSQQQQQQLDTNNEKEHGDIDKPKSEVRSTAEVSSQKAGASQGGSIENTPLIAQDCHNETANQETRPKAEVSLQKQERSIYNSASNTTKLPKEHGDTDKPKSELRSTVEVSSQKAGLSQSGSIENNSLIFQDSNNDTTNQETKPKAEVSLQKQGTCLDNSANNTTTLPKAYSDIDKPKHELTRTADVCTLNEGASQDRNIDNTFKPQVLPSWHAPAETLAHVDERISGQMSSAVTDRKQHLDTHACDTRMSQQQQNVDSGTVVVKQRTVSPSPQPSTESLAHADQCRSGQIVIIAKDRTKHRGSQESDNRMTQQQQDTDSKNVTRSTTKNTTDDMDSKQPVNMQATVLPSRQPRSETLTKNDTRRSGQIRSTVQDSKTLLGKHESDTRMSQQQQNAKSGTVNTLATETILPSWQPRTETLTQNDTRRSGQIRSTVQESKQSPGKHESDTRIPQQQHNTKSGTVNTQTTVLPSQQPRSESLTHKDTGRSGQIISTVQDPKNLLGKHEPDALMSKQQQNAKSGTVNTQGTATVLPSRQPRSETLSQNDTRRSGQIRLAVQEAKQVLEPHESDVRIPQQQQNTKSGTVKTQALVLPSQQPRSESLTHKDTGRSGQIRSTIQESEKHRGKHETDTRMSQQEQNAKSGTVTTQATVLPSRQPRSEILTKNNKGRSGQIRSTFEESKNIQGKYESDTQQQQKAESETVTKCGISANEKHQQIIEKLGLLKYTTENITIKDVLRIDIYENATDEDVKQLPWVLLKRLLSVNSDAMNLRFKPDQERLNSERIKGSVLALFNDTPKLECISPLDVFVLVFQCCDPILKQLLYQKLFLCKMAVPFIYRNLSNFQPLLSLWPLRSFLIESKNKEGANVEFEILDMPTQIVTFARFDRPHYSKSKLLNRILSETSADTFFNRDCPLGTVKRFVTNGYVEMFWLPSIGDTRCRFNETVTFLNMRGDIGKSFQETECAFTAAITDLAVIICDISAFSKQSKDLQKSLTKFSAVIVIIASPIDQESSACQSEIVEFAGHFNNEGDTNMQILSTYAGLHEKSATEMLTEVTELISNYLKTSPNKSKSFEKRQECLAIERRLTSDENGTCTEAKQIALSVIETMQKEAPQENWFNLITPTQSSSSPMLSNLLQQLHKEKTPEQQEEIEQNMEDIRVNQTKRLSKSIQKLTDCLTKYAKSPCFLEYILNWLNYYLEQQKRKVLPDLKTQNTLAWDLYWKMKKDIKTPSTELAKQETLIKQLEEKIDKASFGIENLFREIYHMCDATLLCKKNRFISLANVNNLADVFARMLCNGHVLELLDGNSFYMPTKWMKLILNKVNIIIGNKRVLTLSVLGLQSSGKSTMLNTMFGLQFAASSGRCTRGIHIQLIPLKQPNAKEERSFDYVLIIDTEGLRAPELGNRTYKRDNELATVITGLGDITILNVMGENMSELKDILQITIHAFLRLRLAYEKLDVHHSCYFVHQNVTDITASEKMKVGLQLSIKNLDSVTQESALSEGISNITTFNQVIEFDTERNVWYLPNLWQGNPPLARVNRNYSEAVVDLCKTLILKASCDTKKSYKSLNDIVVYAEDLWKGVLTEDFVFSFRNSLEKRAYVELETKFKTEMWVVEKCVDKTISKISQKHFSQCDNEDSLIKVRSIVIKELKDIVASKEKSLTKQMDSFFSHNNFKDTTIQWKQQTMNNIMSFGREIVDKKVQEIDICRNKRAVDIMTNSMNTIHEVELWKRSIELANELKDTHMTDIEITKRFEQIWETFVTESLKSDTLTKTESSLKNDFMDILAYMYGSHPVLYETLQNEPLNVVNENIHNLSGSFSSTKIGTKDVSVKRLAQLIDKTAGIFNSSSRQTVQDVAFSVARQRLESSFETIDHHISMLCKEDKEITCNDIKLFLREVQQNLESISGLQDNFTLKTTFKIRSCVFVCRFALARFDSHNTEYNKVHGLHARLERYKKQVKERFNAHLTDCQVEETAARLFRLAIEEFLYETVQDRLPLIIKHHLKGELPTLKYNLIIDILIDLAKRGQFHDLIFYVERPKQFAERWITGKSEQILFGTSESQFYILATEEIDKYLKEINSSIKTCGQCLESSPLTIHVWLESFLSNLKTYKVPKECFRDVVRELEQVGNIHLDYFTDLLTQNVDKASKTVALKFRKQSRESIKWAKINPYKEVCTDIWGCPEQCIFCGEPCMKCNIHKESSHYCIQHRPLGCRGVHEKTTSKITLTSCNFNVVSDLNAMCCVYNFLCNQPKKEQCSKEMHPFKQYRTFLPDWDIEPTYDMKDRCKFWMWFIATYKQNLSTRYGVDVSDVPSSWRDIEMEDACESLRSIYK